MARPSNPKRLREMQELLTQEYVQRHFDYNAETGELIRRLASIYHAHLVGRPAGCLDSKGYVKVHIAGYHTYGHILAWIHYYGEWPESEIDHRDKNPSNNCIENLRLGPPPINQKNAKLSIRNQSGYVGVAFCPSASGCKHYKSQTTVDGETYHHGYFQTVEEANAARQAWIATNPWAGFTENHGK